MQREGSAFQGLGVVTFKELSDHLTGVRMIVLEWLVILMALGVVYTGIQQIREVSAEDPFLFLRLFPRAGEGLPSFVSVLSFLVPLELLTTHERDNAGAIRTRRRADTLAVIAEVAAVAAAEGAAIDPEAVARYMDSVPETMESSMQHDQEAGKPLEIDAIGGAVVRRAARAGVDVPVTARLVEELKARG